MVSAYQRPAQLGRLLRALATPNASFAIHVDRKTRPSVFRAMQAAVDGVARVHFLERHVSHWGGFGHVRATLKGLAHAVESGDPFDYLVLLTAQDYPLRPAALIEEQLGDAGGRSYLSYWPLPFRLWKPREGLDRFQDWHFVSYGHLHIALPLRREIPGGLRAFGGGPYWCLARPVVEHVYDFVRRNPEYVRFFEHVYVPDELFFQTIVLNSPHTPSLVNDDLRFIDWSEPRGPTVLRMEHLPRLLESDKLFARKFDESVDAGVLDALDRHLERDRVA